jgi:hypothetical protein
VVSGAPEDVERVAVALRKLSADVRAAGDAPLVRLDEDGVAPAGITLADELWLYALQLDGRFDDDEAVE